MKVLLINTYERGGAAKACLRLHKGLLDIGVNTKTLLLSKNTNMPKVFVYEEVRNKNIDLTKPNLFKRLKRKSKKILREFGLFRVKQIENSDQVRKNNFFQQRSANLEMFSFPESEYDLTACSLYDEADIIHLHWVANFLDYKSFFEKCTKPVIWTLHDMNPFTGGEHYSEIYSGMDNSGKPIPRVLTELEKNTFLEILQIKSDALKNFTNLHIVVLNNWMADQVNNSTLFNGYPLHIIPNGIDSDIFKPRNKNFARDVLGIGNDKTVLLFVSDAVDHYRKGYQFLLKALEKLNQKDLCLCVVGEKSSDLENLDNLFELGIVHDERFMSIIYSAADVFVIPTLMDNLPNTVIESLLCGTPVIGFPVGGMTELIQNGVNGYLTDEISVDSLVQIVQKFIVEKSIFNQQQIVSNARKKYDKTVMVKSYYELYKRILKFE